MLSIRCFFLIGCLACVLLSSARGEHRAALLIGNHRYRDASLKTPARDLNAVAAALQRRGFVCQIAENLDEKPLKAAIESFADSTPTRGTALLYFRGWAGPGDSNQQDVWLAGANSRPGRGYGLAAAIQTLHNRGGSQNNLVVVDSPQAPKANIELPQSCLFAYAEANRVIAACRGEGDLIAAFLSSGQSAIPPSIQITGKGSQSVGSPDAFPRGKKAGDEWVNRRGIVFCWCPPGSYVAGSPVGTPGRYDDEQQRDVIIGEGFWISKYELTRNQNLRARGAPRDSIAKRKLDPLTMVNHDDAKSMTSRTFSESERRAGRLPGDWQYSLPTEEQWEYAARAGTTGRFYFGDDLQNLPQHANFGDKSYYDSQDIYSNAAHRTLDDGAVRLAEVGSYRPNPWGLHDVYGNVAEWCLNTAIRGGSWVGAAENCRSGYRDQFSSRNQQNFIGYRIVIQKTPLKESK